MLKHLDNIFSVEGRMFMQIQLRSSRFQSFEVKKHNDGTDEIRAAKYVAAKYVAAKTHSKITGNIVYLCGFVINPSAPYLGTSLGD